MSMGAVIASRWRFLRDPSPMYQSLETVPGAVKGLSQIAAYTIVSGLTMKGGLPFAGCRLPLFSTFPMTSHNRVSMDVAWMLFYFC
jgi:hypothetical protein